MRIVVEHLGLERGGKTVLSGLTLSLEPGGFHGILGPNGAGKTTFLELMAGQRMPTSGCVEIDGRSIQDFGSRELARTISVVPQSAEFRFPFPVKEVVMMGRNPHIPRFGKPGKGDIAACSAAIRAADLDALSERPVTELSGGERQRVLFARALCQETPVLMLDEATSNLDIRHALSLLSEVKRRTTKGRLAVGIFQDINLAAQFCDRLHVVAEGGLAVSGSPETVVTQGWMEKIYGVSARIIEDPETRRPQVLHDTRYL